MHTSCYSIMTDLGRANDKETVPMNIVYEYNNYVADDEADTETDREEVSDLDKPYSLFSYSKW